jgi:hypothetical protein
METVEGTKSPPGAELHEMPPRPGWPSGEPERRPTTPLADADRHLVAIGAEVAALREELTRLRKDAAERAELLTERETVVAELSGLLPALEAARLEALRRADDASAELTHSEARVAEYASRVIELQQQLDAIGQAGAAHHRTVEDLEARLAEESGQREESDRALAVARVVANAAEHATSEALERLASLSGAYERLLAEREEGNAREQRHAEETSAAMRAAESRLARESSRVEALERELETLEASLADRVVSLSKLEAELAEARSEHRAVSALGAVPHPPVEPTSSSHLRFVLGSGGYTVTPFDGAPPEPGERVEVDGNPFIVAKVAPSPLARDPRLCAYLLQDLPDT